ncbi:MAG: glutathione S-transferase family protein [Rhodospirillales bacterium]|nr:glutathione S-transferase family protein [Rhodospirillales bacterium]
MKLYSLPLSPYAARVRGAIYAKGLPVEIATPPDGWRTSPEFRAINPMLRIPVLVLDDGASIPESAVIVEYLEDAYPGPALRPRSATALARVRLITAVADLYVMQAMMPVFHMADAATRDETAIKAQCAKLDTGLAQLDGLLDAGAYAHDGRLTTADVWLTPVRFSLDALLGFANLPTLLDRHKAVKAYAEVAKRDPVLGRIWNEMADGLKSFMASRAENRPAERAS